MPRSPFNYNNILFFIILFSFSSCVTELDYENSDEQVQYALSCLCCSDEELSLYVYKTYSINQSYTTQIVKQLEVNLLEDGRYVASGSLDDDSVYVFDYTAIASHEYSLEINDTINQISMNVTDSIPSSISITKATYNKNVCYVNDDGDNEYLVTIYIKDESNTDNYYQLIIDGEFKINSSIISYDSYEDGVYPVIFSDELFKNKELELSFYCSKPTHELSIRNISYNYYTYHQSLKSHLENQNILNYYDSPIEQIFNAFPTELYTNVDGGLGIFAGYSETSITPESTKNE